MSAFGQVDPGSATPLYAQIADRVQIAVATGKLVPGVALPSVRRLATQLRVNPGTVARAYRQLEDVGLVMSRQGAGTFVRRLAGPKRDAERRRAARRLVVRLLKDAAGHGVTRDDLEHALTAALRGWPNWGRDGKASRRRCAGV
jgi:GntR family transcriptional regulator